MCLHCIDFKIQEILIMKEGPQLVGYIDDVMALNFDWWTSGGNYVSTLRQIHNSLLLERRRSGDRVPVRVVTAPP